MTVRRYGTYATHLVVNKARDDEQAKRLAEAVPLPLLAIVPYDEAIADAERRGLAPVDVAPECPAVRAAGDLAARLEEMP
jgi:nitrogenase subunit NifH